MWPIENECGILSLQKGAMGPTSINPGGQVSKRTSPTRVRAKHSRVNTFQVFLTAPRMLRPYIGIFQFESLTYIFDLSLTST